jgi:transcriptional regulator with XRE-family HTH domain
MKRNVKRELRKTTDAATDKAVLSVREKLRDAANSSGMTLEQIGMKMGFREGGARQAVSRLLDANLEYDPRLSTLIQFARAVGKPLSDLIWPG